MLRKLDKTTIVAIFLLFTMGVLAFLSMRSDSLTFDELAHIPSGYSYLTKQDYRLNPEHPPPFKDLAAIPLLFLHPNFPAQKEVWQQNNGAPAWWVQFDIGTEFLYHSGNNPRQIILFSRLPMIGLLLFLGWLLFKSSRRLFGDQAALATLFLFAFSPTFLAHGRLVTNDIAAALGAFAATLFWLEFLKQSAIKKGLPAVAMAKAGIVFGIAMLLKFTLALLVPFFALLTLLFLLLNNPLKYFVKQAGKYILFALCAGIIGIIGVVLPVYWFHTWNYPADHQLRDTIADLSAGGLTPVENIDITMTQIPLLRPFAQYFRGVLMAGQRVSFGNTVYFLGKISGSGFHSYFPTLYFFKEPFALHIFSLVVIAGLLAFTIRNAKNLMDVFAWMRKHFIIVSSFIFIVLYWVIALLGNLNIGIRHLLPTYPFVFLILGWSFKELLSRMQDKPKKMFLAFILLLGAWYAGSSLAAFPHYLSYYNEFAGGTSQGWKIAVDSNYDWGQDFYRLLNFVKENNIQKIQLDYFGGENAQYWLEDKYVRLDPKSLTTQGRNQLKGWIAVSVNQLVGGRAVATQGYDQPTDYYRWLDQYTPVARAGNTIFIYHINP